MAEKILNTRILLKYDTYDNWKTNDPVLKKGEVAIATIATGNTQEVNSITAPQVLIKVGDGTSTYNALPFVSAKAADVYGWAKAANKPSYAASEITGISDYIAQYVESEMGISVDTDTQYQIVKGSDDYTYTLQSKGKGDSAWADVSTISIPKYDDSALSERVGDLEGLVGETAVATQIANAITTLDLANTYAAKSHTHAISEVENLEGYLNVYEQAIDTLNGDANTTGSVQKALADAKAYTDEVKAGILGEGISETYNTLKEIQTWIEGDGVNATELTTAIAGEATLRENADTALQNKIDAIDNHSHANKALLDTYAQTEANLADAVAKKHEHSNKDVLDATTASYTTEEQTKLGEFQAASNYVDLASEQTITGSKMFTQGLDVQTAAASTSKLMLTNASPQSSNPAIIWSSNDAFRVATVDGGFNYQGGQKTNEWNWPGASTDAALMRKQDLAAVATSGLIDDLLVGEGTTLIFDCGSSVL